MAKFSPEDKLSAVFRWRDGKETHASIAASIGATKAMIGVWVMQYEQNGAEAFRKSYTSYTAPFKLDVLNYMNTHGTSPNATAAIFQIPSPALIRKWRIQFHSCGIDALIPKKKGRPTMKKGNKNVTPVEGSVEALQQEVERLRMENAYLKKLNALVQSKEKLQTKTKRK
ncbi:transposase [Brevibacillus choshinensis]|uniref:Transposase n=1 Tax=Brevibacillus choshinensis TaxID=54911 RepID=A0ABR5N3E8_BRECH|nr:transposase [Brevibacillus choshinensis]KQL44748.1 transposase [Brevibacillus choshinensis]KQL45037.1 transposase [Brevibacillus choshinensis]KQL48424.1 transposase [Brevibacillus choshinensis]KQL49894.1 transposase [Brevibacillus choshinensis]